MPEERTTMRQVREIVRLHEAGLSKRQIAIRVGVAASTMRLTLRRVGDAGMTQGFPAEQTEVELEKALFSASGKKSGHRQHAEPDWAVIHQELKRKHVTLAIVLGRVHRPSSRGLSILAIFANSIAGGSLDCR